MNLVGWAGEVHDPGSTSNKSLEIFSKENADDKKEKTNLANQFGADEKQFDTSELDWLDLRIRSLLQDPKFGYAGCVEKRLIET